MSDPQQPQIPPYASNPGQPPQPGYPAPGTPAPTAHHYYQGGAPQAPPAQPQYTQPQQAQYGQPVYSPAASGPADSNTPGRIGFIIGLIGLAVSLLTNVIIQIMIRSADYQLIGLVSGALSVLTFLASLAALIFGLIGLRRVGAPHGLAGIATGLGGAGVVGAGFTFILNAVSSVFYF
ncbi:hypothetical protein [Microbacterium murale]|nr:hypothetical protein [Microbacterium murale]